MAINIGTNINYQGHEYLDKRQGLAKSESDLKNWSTLVPNGFEVCVNGSWYVYDENNEVSDTTGYFRKRDAQVELNTANIDEIMHEVFKLSMTVASGVVEENKTGTTFEIGDSITPRINWTVKYKNETVIPDTALVNNSTTGVSNNNSRFTASEQITKSTAYLIKASYNNTSCSSDVTYSFKYKKYFGVSENENLGNEEILRFDSDWADSWKMGLRSFDCTGGKYPYYIIPEEIYNEGNFKMWIGGFPNTDLMIKKETITNSSGKQHPYYIIRTRIKQTGILPIEFK